MSLQISDSRFSNIEQRLEKMRKRQLEFAQTRSTFQLEKFLANEEYTLVSKYRHVSYNSYVVLNNVKDLILERERLQREIRKKNDIIKKKGDTTYKNYDLDIYQLEMRLEEIEVSIKGNLKEVEILESICDKLEQENNGPFTYEQFEADQPKYWEQRMKSRIQAAHNSKNLGISEGLYDVVIKSQEPGILDGSTNFIPKLIGGSN